MGACGWGKIAGCLRSRARAKAGIGDGIRPPPNVNSRTVLPWFRPGGVPADRMDRRVLPFGSQGAAIVVTVVTAIAVVTWVPQGDLRRMT